MWNRSGGDVTQIIRRREFPPQSLGRISNPASVITLQLSWHKQQLRDAGLVTVTGAGGELTNKDIPGSTREHPQISEIGLASRWNLEICKCPLGAYWLSSWVPIIWDSSLKDNHIIYKYRDSEDSVDKPPKKYIGYYEAYITILEW